MAQASHGTDMVSVLVHDHDEVKELFSEIEAATDAKNRRDLADQVTAELVRHSVAEEMYLYPSAREALPNGDQMADEEIQEHAEAEELMKRWEGMDGDDPEFMAVFGQLSSAVLEHIEEEEGQLFPALQAALPSETLEELGKKIQDAKKVAPTRPHPSAPDTPPLNKLLAPGAGLVDRIRDKLSRRST
jgi:hemerythrin superfamily protein